MQKEAIPFVPRCRECGTPLPYDGALHPERSDCPLHMGEVPHDPVEWTVYSLYAGYPILFGRSPWSRWFIFNRLFFCIGTEYKWVNGELRDIFAQNPSVGDAVPFQSLEDEVEEMLGIAPSPRGKDAARKRELIEESRLQARADLQRNLAQFEEMPKKWQPLYDTSPLFTLPENATLPWILAACDATQMFLHGSPDGQSLKWIYTLIEARAQLFTRLGMAPPRLEESRMTIDLFRERSAQSKNISPEGEGAARSATDAYQEGAR